MTTSTIISACPRVVGAAPSTESEASRARIRGTQAACGSPRGPLSRAGTPSPRAHGRPAPRPVAPRTSARARVCALALRVRALESLDGLLRARLSVGERTVQRRDVRRLRAQVGFGRGERVAHGDDFRQALLGQASRIDLVPRKLPLARERTHVVSPQRRCAVVEQRKRGQRGEARRRGPPRPPGSTWAAPARRACRRASRTRSQPLQLPATRSPTARALVARATPAAESRAPADRRAPRGRARAHESDWRPPRPGCTRAGWATRSRGCRTGRGRAGTRRASPTARPGARWSRRTPPHPRWRRQAAGG